MENNIKNWIMDYAVIGCRRFYRKEKIRFIQHIAQDFQQMGYRSSILAPKGTKGKAIDLMIGDIKTADTILIANYDTPVKSFGLYRYKPFNLRHRNLWYICITAIPLICIAAICFLYSTFFLKIEWLKGSFHLSDIGALSLYFIGILMIVRYAKGIPNKRNLNRNSSGVITLLQIANNLNEKQRAHTAFVLTDHGCINHLGDQMIKEYLGAFNHPRFILIDSICASSLAVCYSQHFEKDVQKLDANILRCPCQKDTYNIAYLYPKTLVLSSGYMKKQELICEHVNTRNDVQIDCDRIAYAAQQIISIV